MLLTIVEVVDDVRDVGDLLGLRRILHLLLALVGQVRSIATIVPTMRLLHRYLGLARCVEDYGLGRVYLFRAATHLDI